jgi:hypothetical protein
VTAEVERKFVPLMVSVCAAAPATADDTERLVMLGTGFEAGGCAGAPPSPPPHPRLARRSNAVKMMMLTLGRGRRAPRLKPAAFLIKWLFKSEISVSVQKLRTSYIHPACSRQFETIFIQDRRRQSEIHTSTAENWSGFIRFHNTSPYPYPNPL